MAEKEFIDRIIKTNRVAKVIKGGRRFSFCALVVIGDQNGTIGIGYGKAREIPTAVQKAIQEAKKTTFYVPRIGSTIPHPIEARKAAGQVLLKPASPGTGVIAGGPIRAILECAGINDILSKSLGSSNAINIAQATIAALKQLEQIDSIQERRDLPIEEVAPNFLIHKYNADKDGCSHDKNDSSDKITDVKVEQSEVSDKVESDTVEKVAVEKVAVEKTEAKTTDKPADKKPADKKPAPKAEVKKAPVKKTATSTKSEKEGK
jgi:small subunit ribosomal protein S5